MIVWASELNEEDFCNAIRADTEITHPNKVVQEAEIAFCLSVRYLLINRNDPQRALKAFNVAIDYINNILDEEIKETITEWILLA